MIKDNILKIKRFTLNSVTALLSIDFADEDLQFSSALSYEFIRISSLIDNRKGKSANEAPVITHKKQVKLLSIEAVGKHGYRFIFDDQHIEIYTEDYLLLMSQQKDELWQQYLLNLKQSGHTREATISITQL